MATNQEILQHITGHTGGIPLQLNWQQHFTPVQNAPIQGRSAFTDAPFGVNASPPNRPDTNGNYHFQNIRITVNMSRGSSWVLNGQQSGSLLSHEQGHYNITWLVMRELCRQLLDDEWSSTVLQATSMNAGTRFTQDFNRLAGQARSEVTRLNQLYDQQTNHGGVAAMQTQWDRMLQFCIRNPENDPTTLLMISGGAPSGF
jgi:hypothetical protein